MKSSGTDRPLKLAYSRRVVFELVDEQSISFVVDKYLNSDIKLMEQYTYDFQLSIPFEDLVSNKGKIADDTLHNKFGDNE